jgi:hypothetical protein
MRLLVASVIALVSLASTALATDVTREQTLEDVFKSLGEIQQSIATEQASAEKQKFFEFLQSHGFVATNSVPLFADANGTKPTGKMLDAGSPVKLVDIVDDWARADARQRERGRL